LSYQNVVGLFSKTIMLISEVLVIMKQKFLAFFALTILLGVTFIPAVRVAAQSNGLGVTPKISLSAKPGAQLRDSLRVNNLSSTQPLTIKVNLVDFKPANESGTPQLLQDTNAPLTPWSLKPYISLPELVNVPAGQSKTIPFTIKFPENIGAGSYYSAVEYQAVTGTDQQKVNIAASSATLLFVNVEGNASEFVNILQFGPSDAQGNIKSSFSQPPTYFAFRVKNSGNLNEPPSGSIVVKNTLGHIVAHIDNVNPKSELALIGQTRKFIVCNPKSTQDTELVKNTNCTPLKLTPGHYSSQLVLLYGQNGQPSRQIGATAGFWYMPLWAIVVAVAILAAVIWGIYTLYRRFSAPRGRRR
jgi:hypothetical protein